MGRLDGFAGLGFVGQVALLDALETEGATEALPELIALCEHPLGDEAVDQVVRDTTGTLLRRDVDRVCEGLLSGGPTLRSLCLRAAAEMTDAPVVQALERLAGGEKDPEVLRPVLSLLVKAGAKKAPGLLRRHVRSPDPVLAAQAIAGLGACRDRGAVKFLTQLVEDAAADGQYQSCDLPTGAAVDALGEIGGDAALAYLASVVHHRNPIVRRMVAQQLHRAGEAAVAPLVAELGSADPDQRILAANALGEIGLGAAALEAMVAGEAAVNVRFAVYEALGKMPDQAGLAALAGGLADADPSVVLAVVTALDQRTDGPAAVLGALLAGGAGAARVAEAVVTCGADAVLPTVAAVPGAAELLAVAAEAAGTAEARGRVEAALRGAGHEDLAARVAAAAGAAAAPDRPRLLAVDDSKSMLMFYQAVASGLGYEVVTAPDGQAALTLLQLDPGFAFVVTDLNMPEMDGITLTRKLRQIDGLAEVPVLMVTTESEGTQVELARAAGVTAFAVKPLTPEAFGERIEACRRG